ncbi:MAG: MMPL family transporter [Alphaproteobacteria bacterium]|nr:MMPL family transporter [Alphaproteobacteria bacterium]
MLASLIAACTRLCVRIAPVIALLALVATSYAVYFAATHFKINTDTTKLVSPEIPWRKQEAAFRALFPQPANMILIVIDGATPERAQDAAAKLTAELSRQPALFQSLRQPGGGSFFEKNGLLYLPLAQTQSATEQIIAAQPFLGALAADPTLRGAMDALSTALMGVERGAITLDRLERPLSEFDAALKTHFDGKPAPLSWRKMMMAGEPDLRETRRVIEALVAVNFGTLKPGEKPTRAIREAAQRLNLTPAHGVTLRLTGPVPIFDEEFGTLTENAIPIASATIGVIVLMLWFALKSVRLILCVIATILTGLTVTTALGLYLVGAFNIMSVAFVALFVGLGVDFGIQFCVRYRAERHDRGDLTHSIVEAARAIGPSLTLAAFAIAAGFYGFLPTSYRGVAELGLIAGTGMLITYLLSLTLLPALIKLTKPKDEAQEAGFASLGAIDRTLLRLPGLFVVFAIALGAAAVALLPGLAFDFNLLNLRSRASESISTLLDLAHDPDRSPNAMDALANSREEAAALATRLRALPAVAKAVTIDDLIPHDQEQKLALVADAQLLLDLTLNPAVTKPAPTDAETVASIRATAEALRKAAATTTNSATATSLAASLARLANADPAAREKVAELVTAGLPILLGNVRSLLTAGPVTLESLPKDTARDFVAPSGELRVRIYPKGDPTDNTALSRFVAAVKAVAPGAVGVPLALEESGRTITGAFTDAGVYSFLVIALILALALRDVRDVLFALVPLVLAGALTLATCVAIGLKLNYANIIALPLLFGIGVAFDIYFVMAWRAGNRALLQSPLTRAVMFSAGATAAGFGALWFSSHPGTSSMGALLMISLLWILFVVLFVLPPLLKLASARSPS